VLVGIYVCLEFAVELSVRVVVLCSKGKSSTCTHSSFFGL
jgi:hypothetical protein